MLAEADLSPVTLGRRAEIREAALTLMADRGYHGTSMESIARVVGIRASSLYNHIRSKHDLLVDIMVTTMKQLLSDFDATNAFGRPADRIRSAMDANVRYHALHPRDVRIGNTEIQSLEEPDRSLVIGLRDEYAHKWRTLIEAGISEGEFSTPSARLATFALLEMAIGVSLWYHPDGPLSLDQVTDYYCEMSVRLLGYHEG